MATANQNTAYNYFLAQGWSPNFSQAMVANLSGESGQGLNTATLQGGDASWGGGNGIASWSPQRFAALGSPTTLQGQLAGVVSEVNSGAYGPTAALTTSTAPPQSIINTITGNFENPQVNNSATRWNNYAAGGLATGSGDPVSPGTDGPSESGAYDPDSGMFDNQSTLGPQNADTGATGGLPYTQYAGGAGGSFAPGNPEGYGASGATDAPSNSAVAYNPDSNMFDGNSGVGSTLGTGAPVGTATSGTGSFMGDGTAPSSASDGSGNSVAVSTTQAPVDGDLTQFSVAGVNAPAASAITPASTAAAPAAPQGTGGTGQGGGSPVTVTNTTQTGLTGDNAIAKAQTEAGQATAKAVTGAGQAVQSAEGNAAAAGTSWLGSIFSGATNLLVRGGFILIGLVILLGAFVFFYSEQTKPTAGGS